MGPDHGSAQHPISRERDQPRRKPSAPSHQRSAGAGAPISVPRGTQRPSQRPRSSSSTAPARRAKTWAIRLEDFPAKENGLKAANRSDLTSFNAIYQSLRSNLDQRSAPTNRALRPPPTVWDTRTFRLAAGAVAPFCRVPAAFFVPPVSGVERPLRDIPSRSFSASGLETVPRP